MAAPRPRDAPVTRHTLALSATIEIGVVDDGAERRLRRVVSATCGVEEEGANAEAEDDANATAPTTSAVADINFIMRRLSMQV